MRIIQKSWHIAVLRFADENFLLQNYIVKHSLEMLHICYPQSYKIVISKVKKHIANIIFFKKITIFGNFFLSLQRQSTKLYLE